MKPSRLLVRLASGAGTNVEFSDALRLVEALGFEELRIAGSHHVFARHGIAEQLNLQDRWGQAKPYQLRQLMTSVQRYDLRVEDDSWVADAPDLAYCSAVGDTPHEAVAEVEIAIRAWLEAATSSGRAIPEPSARMARA